jgi:hypothetical protein
VVKHESTNGHLKDICLKEIGIHAQNELNNLGLIVNVVGGVYMTT